LHHSRVHDVAPHNLNEAAIRGVPGALFPGLAHHIGGVARSTATDAPLEVMEPDLQEAPINMTAVDELLERMTSIFGATEDAHGLLPRLGTVVPGRGPEGMATNVIKGPEGTLKRTDAGTPGDEAEGMAGNATAVDELLERMAGPFEASQRVATSEGAEGLRTRLGSLLPGSGPADNATETDGLVL